jgi:hypothetical protein
MITFQQLCEHLTCFKRYSHFIFERCLWEQITAEEASIVHAQIIDEKYVRLWYPKERWAERRFGETKEVRLAIEKKIKAAALNFDFDEVKRLQQLMKEL